MDEAVKAPAPADEPRSSCVLAPPRKRCLPLACASLAPMTRPRMRRSTVRSPKVGHGPQLVCEFHPQLAVSLRLVGHDVRRSSRYFASPRAPLRRIERPN